jgi:hypothetical protein
LTALALTFEALIPSLKSYTPSIAPFNSGSGRVVDMVLKRPLIDCTTPESPVSTFRAYHYVDQWSSLSEDGKLRFKRFSYSISFNSKTDTSGGFVDGFLVKTPVHHKSFDSTCADFRGPHSIIEVLHTININRREQSHSENDKVNFVQRRIKTGHDKTIQTILSWVKADGDIDQTFNLSLEKMIST